MSKPTLYRNRLIPLESILLTNDEILYHDDKKIITFWKTLHPKSDLAYGYSCYFLDRGFKISRFYSHSHDFMYWYCDIIETNYEKDPLFGNTRDSLIYVNDYPGDHDKMDPYISPLFGNFRGFPPMLIQVGSIEMLLSDSVEAAAKARIQGVKVRLSVYEGMFHVFQMGYLNFPESKRAWAEVKRFLKVIKEEE